MNIHGIDLVIIFSIWFDWFGQSDTNNLCFIHRHTVRCLRFWRFILIRFLQGAHILCIMFCPLLSLHDSKFQRSLKVFLKTLSIFVSIVLFHARLHLNSINCYFLCEHYVQFQCFEVKNNNVVNNLGINKQFALCASSGKIANPNQMVQVG